MALDVTETHVRRILTRTSGYLDGIASHSLQPYRGCSFGNALCGVGCYVRANRWLLRGQAWGSFLEARVNAAACYRAEAEGERAWARRRGERFAVFLSSSTDPFVPHEERLQVTAGVLDALLEQPPELLIVQTHSASVARRREQLSALAARAELRVHLSIESDRDRLPGLPPPASPVDARLAAAAALKAEGLFVVVTVAPLLPIEHPRRFFDRLAQVADAVVLDHFVGGDGTPDGRRTRATPLPAAMEALAPGSSDPSYRDRMVEIARQCVPRVGVGRDGFAARWLP